MEDNNEYMRGMVRYAPPHADSISDEPDRFRRRWIARVTELLPSQNELAIKSIELTKSVANALMKSYGELATAEQLFRSRIDIELIRGDDHHIITEIICPQPQFRVGDAPVIGTWLPLRAIDVFWQIEELEGIPKRFWFQLQHDAGYTNLDG
jgi:hypothetical protein